MKLTGLALAAALALALCQPAGAQVAFRAAEQAGVASAGDVGYVGSGAANVQNGCGTANPPVPAGVVAGDLLITVIEAGASPTISAAGWTELFLTNPNGNHTAAVYWRIATGGDPNAFTQSGTCNVLIARMSAFTGVDATQPFETAPVPGGNLVSQNAGNVDTGTQTTTVANAMLVITTHVTDDRGSAVPAGFTEAFDSTTATGNDVGIALKYQVQTTAGAKGPFNNMDLTGGGSDWNTGALFALRPAALRINVPAGTVANDVMVASIAVRPSGSAVYAPAGWTLVRETAQGAGTSSRMATYYRVAGGAEPADYVWTFSGTATGAVGGIGSFSGVDVSNPIDAEGGNATPNALTHTAGSIATTVANSMLVGSFEFGSAPMPGNWSAGAGTEMVDVTSIAPPSAAGIALLMSYEPWAAMGATGTRSATASGVGADTGVAHLLALRPIPTVVFDVLSGDYNLACTAYPIDVTIVAKDTNGNLLPAYANLVNIGTSTATGDWTVGTANGTLNNGAAGDGAATYQFDAADTGRIVLRLAVGAVSTLTVTVQEAATGFSSAGIPINFVADGYVVVTDPIQVAGRPQALTVERRTAPGCNLNTSAGHNGFNQLKVWLSLDASHPGGATLPGATGVTTVNPLPIVEPGGNNLWFLFAGGQAPLTLDTSDVGKYRIHVRDGNLGRRGTSPAITTRPFALAMPGIAHSTQATDPVLAIAGADFGMTVGAYLWAAADDADDNGVVDANANVTDNGLTPSYAWDTTLSVPTGQVLPAGGADGAFTLGGAAPTIPRAGFAGGSVTLANARYSEVGSVFVAASATGFLDTPGVNVVGDSGLDGTGAAGGYVGRFRPDHFVLSAVALENRSAAGCASPSVFTHMDEGLQFGFTLTARNAQSSTTAKYDGSYARLGLTTFANFGVGARSGATDLTGRVDGGVSPAGTWSSGVGTVSLTTGVRRPTPDSPDGPYASVNFGIAPVDPDSVSMNTLDLDVDGDATNERKSLGVPTEVRYGRLRMQNALGSGRIGLPVAAETQYWNGSTFVRNGDDDCTSIPRNAIALGSFVGALAPAPNCKTYIQQDPVTFTGGVGALTLAAPTGGATGSVLLTPNLGATAAGAFCADSASPPGAAAAASLPYLLGRWNDTDDDADASTAYDDSPAARAAFGLYGSQPGNFIYFRENF